MVNKAVTKLHKGPLAQLVERFHGMEEVAGSNPVRSTRIDLSPAGWQLVSVGIIQVEGHNFFQ